MEMVLQIHFWNTWKFSSRAIAAIPVLSSIQAKELHIYLLQKDITEERYNWLMLGVLHLSTNKKDVLINKWFSHHQAAASFLCGFSTSQEVRIPTMYSFTGTITNLLCSFHSPPPLSPANLSS